MSDGQLAQQRHQLVVALDRDGRAGQRAHGGLLVGEGHHGMERAQLGAGCARRLEHRRVERARGVHGGLARVQAQLGGDIGDGIVGHGHEDEVDVVGDGRDRGHRVGRGHQSQEAMGLGLIARGDGRHRPAGAR